MTKAYTKPFRTDPNTNDSTIVRDGRRDSKDEVEHFLYGKFFIIFPRLSMVVGTSILCG